MDYYSMKLPGLLVLGLCVSSVLTQSLSRSVTHSWHTSPGMISITNRTTTRNSSTSQICSGEDGASSSDGWVTSPNYPFDYHDDINCNFTITVSSGKYVVLNIEEFRTEQCCDRLEVYDVQSGERLRQFRGYGVYSPVVHGISNRMRLLFRTDGSVTAPGWNITWTESDEEGPSGPYTTSAILTTTQGQLCNGASAEGSGSSGSLSSPNYPNDYANNLHCNYSITVSTGRFAVLHFDHFDTEQCCDFLEVYDAPSGLLLGSRLRGNNEFDRTIYGISNRIHMVFYSDYSITESGWTVSWTESDSSPQPGFQHTSALPPSTHHDSECGTQNFASTQGWLASPDYPNNYQNYVQCTYTITVSQGMYVSLTLRYFNTELCCDFVEVYDTPSGQHLQTFQGEYFYQPTVLGLSNQMTLIFHSDGSIVQRGWNFTWAESNEAGVVTTTTLTTRQTARADCGLQNFNSSSGHLTSIHFPSDYDNNEDCTYIITVSNGKFVELTVHQFRTESCCDRLHVYDVQSSNLLRTMHGSYYTATTIYGLSNQMRLEFTTDGSVVSQGWNLTWTEADTSRTTPRNASWRPAWTTIPTPICNMPDLTGSNGTFTSPNFPNGYSNNLWCVYNITVPQGKYVVLNVNQFQLESCCDWLRVYDAGSGALLRALGGELYSPYQIHGISNRMNIVFTTDGSVTFNGWNISWETSDNNVTASTYQWTRPAAWDSARLYPWGNLSGDHNMLDERMHSWDMYECKNVRLNGLVGAPFFSNRYYGINICDNGVMQLNLEWRLDYPVLFETDSWYDDIAIIAPFWASSDEYVMNNLMNDFPNATSKVYYHEYHASFNATNQTKAVLSRAKDDVKTSGVSVANFEPTWVLVVTWINLAPNDACRIWNVEREVDYNYDYSFNYSYNYNGYGHDYNSGSFNYRCDQQARSAVLNHFQAVFITDGTYSFVKYNYPEEGINWATPGITANDSAADIERKLDSGTGWFPMAIGGYSSGDISTGAEENRKYVTGSNQIQMMNIDNVTGNYPDGRIGEWLFRIEDSNGAESASALCDKWLSQQDIEKYEDYNRNVSCPQTIMQVWWDPAFQYHSSLGDSVECFQSVFASDAGFRQRCCYSDDEDSDEFSSLVLGPPYGGHVVDTQNSEAELVGWQACCVEAIDMCGQFYKGRPYSDGENYTSPALWPWFGDPHIITSDGFSYTFNGLGEYLFTKVGDNDTVIQARTERVVNSDGDLGQATYFSAVCVGGSGLPRVQIQIDKFNLDATDVVDILQLIIDGDFTDIGQIAQDSNTTQELPGITSNLLFKRTNASVTVLFSTGISLTVSANNRMLTITLGLPASTVGKTIGLTGVFDHNTTNDLTWPNATGHISINSSESEIFEWASLFAVSESSSIMFYTEENTNWTTYNNNDFVPVFTDDVDNWEWSSDEFRQSAYDVCMGDEACLYDVFVTGDIAVGESSRNTAQQSSETNAILGNSAPTISAPSSVLITVGEEFTISGSVSDSNGDFVTVQTNIPGGLVVTRADGNFVLTATVRNTTNFRLSIIAKDPAGATSTRVPLAMLCNCANDGTCTALSESEQADIDHHSVFLSCACPPGYTGSLCESDLDACALVASPCYPGVLCEDSPPPAGRDGLTCGDCPAGYEGNGITCSDVDECALDSCDHVCINSPGSFLCTCRAGYELGEDGYSCTDIDECDSMDPCHHDCANLDGSYSCSCNNGYTLADDKHNCKPNNPCSTPHDCDIKNGYCNIIDGVEECSCKRGFSLDEVNTCLEIDECALGIDGCSHNCDNTLGGYLCSCNKGYILASNGLGCDDVNECFLGIFSCPSSQSCANTPGSYECVCPTGQTYKHGVCQVILFTDPVEPVVVQVEEEVELNAVQFTLEGITLEEYTVEKEILLFSELAESATEACSDGGCEIIRLESEARRRRKRSAAVTFHKEYFARLPGSPSANGDDGINLAIYSKVPGSGVLESSKLLQALRLSSEHIQDTLGVTVSNVQVMYEPTTRETTETGSGKNQVVMYAAIGGGAAALLLIIMIAAAVVGKKAYKSPVSPSSIVRPPVRVHLPANNRPTPSNEVPSISRGPDAPINTGLQLGTMPSGYVHVEPAGYAHVEPGTSANYTGPMPSRDPLPIPSYEPPVVVVPTNLAFPATRPLSASKQTQGHYGRASSPPPAAYAPVDPTTTGYVTQQ